MMERFSGAGSSSNGKSHSLFQVYLRLRPSPAALCSERFLALEEAEQGSSSLRQITLNPPNDRRRAIEKFAFTQVFEEDATQLDVFHCTNVMSLVEGVLAPHGGEGTDALLATLGVTGSGKTHTILGSRSQRGLTQLALDVMFRSLGDQLLDCSSHSSLDSSIAASDASEGQTALAQTFLEHVYTDASASGRLGSRATTPLLVRSNISYDCQPPFTSLEEQEEAAWDGAAGESKSIRLVQRADSAVPVSLEVDACFKLHGPKKPSERKKSRERRFMKTTSSMRQKTIHAKTESGTKRDSMGPSQTPSRRLLNRPSTFPQQPDVSALTVSCDPSAEYVVVMSMYEVYNDRIFDLLVPAVKCAATKEYRRRHLLFKFTEGSPDRKLVAGLKKIVCSNLSEALLLLEAGLHERRVAGTGSNSVSSRSHGFFSIEVKKRVRKSCQYGEVPWVGTTLTIVDLAGSERARDAKTAGATLAEAGKINESLMYLGQCLQMQSAAGKDKPNIVPFRQCKLTELLFSNSFPSPSSFSASTHRNPQRGVMIVAADPRGDFNATSQILRYSALAREVTVPRVPSMTQTMMSAHTPALNHVQSSSGVGLAPVRSRPFFSSGPEHAVAPFKIEQMVSSAFQSPCSESSEQRSTMELAALQIARLSEELNQTRQALEEEKAARVEAEAARIQAEARLVSIEERLEDRMLEYEHDIREECSQEFEQRLAIELARHHATMQAEQERGEEHWGRKIEVLERMAQTVTEPSDDGEEDANDEIWEGDDKENVLLENVNEENERLRRDNEVLRRELAGLSPTKRAPLQERASDVTKSSKLMENGSPRSSGRLAWLQNSSLHQGKGPFGSSLTRKMQDLRVVDEDLSARKVGGTKKMRKLAKQRWDGALDEDLF